MSAGPHDRGADPMRSAQRLARPEFPKRFYKEARAEPGEGGFVLVLDGRPALTPGRRPVAVPDAALAGRLATEWNDLGETIDPGRLPITRIVNSALDGVAAAMAEVRADIVRYAGADLLCYRAGEPEGLVARQEAVWSPLVDWARGALGIRLVLAEGVMHVRQSEEALAAVACAVEPFDALGLAALHAVTTLTGSAVIALAVARGRLDADAAWAAAHLDEDWQIAQWGEDAEATARRAARKVEMDAAATILGAVAGRA